ncbi:MAG: type II toxin-antitoxin system VapC family toxin [Alphaproteobacteria bacterium]|nr:type II toxin-antitoxin system VapC family toxin [Alphaproteobacteria bacterium]
MPGYLLDTNIVSDLVRRPGGPVAARIAEVGEAEIATSAIVAAELRYGAVKSGSARLTQRLSEILDRMYVTPFEAPADVIYGRLRVALERLGRPIGGNDLLIAAQAFANNATLVTANAREFARVEGLALENWLA